MLVVLNHKSNLTYKEIIEYEQKIKNLDVIVLPSICYMSLFNNGNYVLGSQDISEFKENSRTGEINGLQLRSLGVKYCLIGHSERRMYNKESNETMLIKLNNCFENDIIPVYCIGEAPNENKKEILSKEIDLVLKHYNNKEIIFAYEPIANIGKDNPNLETIQETIFYIKEYISEEYKKDVKLLYGGGVSINNIDDILEIKGIDGVLFSTDSLKLDNLKIIYDKCKTK